MPVELRKNRSFLTCKVKPRLSQLLGMYRQEENAQLAVSVPLHEATRALLLSRKTAQSECITAVSHLLFLEIK